MDLDFQRPQIGWQSRYTATPRWGTLVAEQELVWKPCPICQQQNRIISCGMWVLCPWCLGVGQVPSV